MTIKILTILALLMASGGFVMHFLVKEAPTYDELIEARLTSNGLILVGIFLLLLAILFKLNPFW